MKSIFYNRILLVIILSVAFSVNSFSQVKLTTAVSREILYNGIELPSTWPPANQDPAVYKPMDVPYLRNIPKVIPIDIGRQLFVDDFLIEKTSLKRIFHQAEKYEGNPVFKPTTKYELELDAVTYLGHGGVFYEPIEKNFQMFYTAGWRGGLALATSKDLINWTRPELSLAGGNLIMPAGGLDAGADNCIWLDLNAKNSKERYKFLSDRLGTGDWRKYYNNSNESPTHTLHASADGRIWSQGVPTDCAADYCSFFYNPFRDLWIFSIKQGTKHGRARYYLESKEFFKGRHWKDAVYWVNADSLDLPDPAIGDPAQLYSLNAVAYESILLGEFYIHLGPKNEICYEGKFPKITDIKLGFSRDGFHWDRQDRRPFINTTRRDGDWDKAYIHGTTGVMLVMGDKLWFPYTGYSGVAPDGSKGMYHGASIGMATLRRDGFASMLAGKKEGVLETRAVSFKGKYLFVNIDCVDGAFSAEVLNEKNEVIRQLSRNKCEILQVDKTLQQVRWKGVEDLSFLNGQPIKFRFYLKNGNFYSFWVSPDKSGASYGYVGAGGPGFDGTVDTKGTDAYPKK